MKAVRERLARLRRRGPTPAPEPAPAVEQLVVTPSGRHEPTSLNDFTVTVDTKASGGDRLVLHLDREGEPTLHMQVAVAQLMWLLDDPAMFAEAYAHRANWADPYATPEPVEVRA
jgi:hypothetical protein